jgi:hypothetical protein
MNETLKIVLVSLFVGSIVGIVTHFAGAPAYIAGSVAGAVCGVVAPMLKK